MNAKVLPSNIEAEEMVLGILVQRQNKNVSEVMHFLLIDDFYNDTNKYIYIAISELYVQNAPINRGTIAAYLEEKNQLKKIGNRDSGIGVDYLINLNQNAIPSQDCMFYAKKIKAAAQQRAIIFLSEKIKTQAEAGQNIKDIFTDLEAATIKIKGPQDSQEIKKLIDNCKKESFEDTIKKHREIFTVGGVRTGLPKLDNATSFLPGTLNVIQAPTGQGKTAFMLNLFCNFLNRRYNPAEVDCVFITYETSALVVRERAINTLSILANRDMIFKRRFLSMTDLYQADMQYFDYNTIPDIGVLWDDFLERGNIRIFEKIHLDLLSELITVSKSRGRTLVLFLDYIQKINHNFSGAGWENMKNLAYTLERLAVENEIIIITGSQVTVKENMILDPREGQDIANAATNIISLMIRSHPKYKNNKSIFLEPTQEGLITSLEILKARGGALIHWGEYLYLRQGVFYENKASQDYYV